MWVVQDKVIHGNQPRVCFSITIAAHGGHSLAQPDKLQGVLHVAQHVAGHSILHFARSRCQPCGGQLLQLRLKCGERGQLRIQRLPQQHFKCRVHVGGPQTRVAGKRQQLLRLSGADVGG